MHSIVSRSLVAALLAALLPCARASEIHVPADYSTIQAAMNAATAGDTVIVAPGTYYENINFGGKAITVESSDGPSATTIDGGGVDCVVRFVSGEPSTTVLDGFHLTNGFGPATNYPYDGGGISCHANSNPVIRNNLIDYCGGLGAGGISCDASSPTIEANRIWNNSGVTAGGIMNYAGASPLIIDCNISWNTAANPGWGGGIQCSFSSPIVVNSVIAFNTANFEGGGIQHGDHAAATLVNCVIWGNTCAGSGGIFVWLSTITLWNCVVRNNSADQIHLASGSAQADTHSCDIEGGWGSSDIDADPLFVDPANGDFHLRIGSPCVDAGNTNAPDFPNEDFEGDPRVMGLSVDIGADEQLLAPVVQSVSPNRTRYDNAATALIHGRNFSIDPPIAVRFGTLQANNVIVLDDANFQCDVPASEPGPVDVGVANSDGEGVLPFGFVYTPAITIDGDPTLGASITIHYLCDPGDGIFSVLGLPPAVSVPTPPFDGDLAIVPFHYFFYVTSWPFDDFAVPATVPNDPALVGVDVLLQSLIGPQLTKPPKDGAWTNYAVLSIH